jgi:hypothetical protein
VRRSFERIAALGEEVGDLAWRLRAAARRTNGERAVAEELACICASLVKSSDRIRQDAARGAEAAGMLGRAPTTGALQMTVFDHPYRSRFVARGTLIDESV